MKVLSLPASLGHFSSHLDLTKEYYVFSEELVSVMKVQMESMTVKFLIEMEELRLSMLGFTVVLSVRWHLCVMCTLVPVAKVDTIKSKYSQWLPGV